MCACLYVAVRGTAGQEKIGAIGTAVDHQRCCVGEVLCNASVKRGVMPPIVPFFCKPLSSYLSIFRRERAKDCVVAALCVTVALTPKIYATSNLCNRRMGESILQASKVRVTHPTPRCQTAIQFFLGGFRPEERGQDPGRIGRDAEGHGLHGRYGVQILIVVLSSRQQTRKTCDFSSSRCRVITRSRHCGSIVASIVASSSCGICGVCRRFL